MGESFGADSAVRFDLLRAFSCVADIVFVFFGVKVVFEIVVGFIEFGGEPSSLMFI